MSLKAQIVLLVVWVIVVFGGIAYCNEEPQHEACEVYNIDTDQCEAISDQNFSIHPVLVGLLQ